MTIAMDAIKLREEQQDGGDEEPRDADETAGPSLSSASSSVSRESRGGKPPTPSSPEPASAIASASPPAALAASASEANDHVEPPLPASRCVQLWRLCCRVYRLQEFLFQVIIAICLAKAYPPLGADYLQPQITATWLAVIYIFFLSGWGLPTEDFAKSAQLWRFNLLVLAFNFGVDSAVAYGVARFLLWVDAIDAALADGLVVCASLSISINVALVITANCRGDQASTLFNSSVGNLVGVVLTPLLILGYLGVTGDNVNLPSVFLQLGLRIVLPLFLGQLLRKLVPTSVPFYNAHEVFMVDSSQLALVFILYTVFCKTFANQSGAVTGGAIMIMIVVVFFTLVFLMMLAWAVLAYCHRDEPELRVSGLFCCTHKTVAMGVPLITALYGDSVPDVDVALITLPLLIWFNMQLLLGTLLTPKLAAWVERERVWSSAREGAGDSGGGRSLVTGQGGGGIGIGDVTDTDVDADADAGRDRNQVGTDGNDPNGVGQVESPAVAPAGIDGAVGNHTPSATTKSEPASDIPADVELDV